MGVVYTFVNGEKKYLYLPKVDKPAYWIARNNGNSRTYYKVYLDGTSNSTTLTDDWGYSSSSAPLMTGHKYFSNVQRTVLYHSNCDSVPTTGATMTYKIYDGNMSLIKTLTHPIEWPSHSSYSSIIQNNDRNLILTMFTGFNNDGTTETVNPRYLRIIDTVNLRVITKSFSWSNGKISQPVASYWNPTTQRLRILFKDWYDTTGYPNLQNQCMNVKAFDVNLTSDEWDVQPIYNYNFYTLASPYFSYIYPSFTYGWDPQIFSMSPCTGSASISGATRAVGALFYAYDFKENKTWTTSHTQSFMGGAHCRGGIIKSPNGAFYETLFPKWTNVSVSDTTLFRWYINPNDNTQSMDTPTNVFGQAKTTVCYIQSWNEKYCYSFRNNDGNHTAPQVTFYWIDNNNNYNYYSPTFYESRTGNTVGGSGVSGTYSIGSNSSYSQYIAINRTEPLSSNPPRYMNVWDRNNIYNTIKLDLYTNTAFANAGLTIWTGFFSY